jgi:hypothetical protein
LLLRSALMSFRAVENGSWPTAAEQEDNCIKNVGNTVFLHTECGTCVALRRTCQINDVRLHVLLNSFRHSLRNKKRLSYVETISVRLWQSISYWKFCCMLIKFNIGVS